jgi:ATP-dependent Clp protease ATP-binding subunit ClpA
MINPDSCDYVGIHGKAFNFKTYRSPPGYVGYEEGGTLTETVRHRPYSVILFDEIEKAHPEVFNLLLQVLDNGRLTDSKGRVVNFKNTVIIMTSNIGAQYIDKMEQIGFTTSKENVTEYNTVKEKVTATLKDYFRPEFLNRLDEIIIFDILSKEAIRKIVDIQMSQVRERLEAKEISLDINEKALDYLAREGYNPQYGARPLRRLIQDKILNQISSFIISGAVMKGGLVTIGIKGDELNFEIKKGKKGMIIEKEVENFDLIPSDL